MQFNSIVFIVFIIVVCCAYILLPQKVKPWLLLFASFYFYGYWNIWAPVFLTVYALMIYLLAMGIEKKRKFEILFVILAIILSVFLFIGFRYNGLFSCLSDIFSHYTGIPLEIIFPLGFSYYMFKSLSYVFDVYQEKIPTAKKFQNFLLYVSYFPEIIIGPISRAIDFLPQVDRDKPFDPDTINRSALIIIVAFAKKLILADTLAIVINNYITSGALSNGLSWFFICFAFCIQLYLDFSAYSDISIAISNILGFNIKPNFRAPFFSKTISDYWRRWHISLSSWLLDYVFTPLQFSLRRFRIFASVFAAICTLIFSGMWHGSTQNWFLYGLIMGIIIGVEALTAKIRKRIAAKTPQILSFIISHLYTIIIILLLSTFILTHTYSDAQKVFLLISRPASYSVIGVFSTQFYLFVGIGLVVTIFSHLFELDREKFLGVFYKIPLLIRYVLYIMLFFSIIFFGVAGNDIYGGFIYAQY